MLIPWDDVQGELGLWLWSDKARSLSQTMAPGAKRVGSVAFLQSAKGERKNGENKVFPIQVSRQELLLFLGAVIVIGTYESIVSYDYPSTEKRKLSHFRVNGLAGHFPAKVPTQDRNRRGRYLPHPGP